MPLKKKRGKGVEPLPSLQDFKSINLVKTVQISAENEEETEVAEEWKVAEGFPNNDKSLSRTFLLIQDYREFRAARSMQRFVRGWLCRNEYRRQQLAAVKIQSEWRRFYCQRMYFRKYEDFLQQEIEHHFHRAAQRIQALWRGWWVRHHIHDQTRLKRLQLMAGEDLLYCVAFKLHHLLRTHQIPGVYSLRDSNAFSKVEQLLASLKFKTFNQRSIKAAEDSRREIETARKEHKKSAYGTKVPFPGASVKKSGGLKCQRIYNAKDADLRMANILQLYAAAHREISKPAVLRKKTGCFTQPRPCAKSSSFCADVVNSMKKWNIINETGLNVNSNILKKPQNVENFLKEIDAKMTLVQRNCYCRRKWLDAGDSEALKAA